jgi:hypothetical protein
MTTTSELSISLRNCLERVARGPSEQLGPRSDGMTFTALADKLEERGLVRSVRHRNRTRTYALTSEGKACLAGMRQHNFGVP